MDFYEKAGKMALGSRLRRLSELMTEQAGSIYEIYHIDLEPKWFPVFYALSAGDEKPIMEIAEEIGHTHPSVSKTVKEMMKAGILKVGSNKSDLRKTYIRLTEKGLKINAEIQIQYQDVNSAVEKTSQESQYNLWKAIEEWEFLLGQKDLITRVKEEKKLRESKEVEIIEYQPKYQKVFKQLNEDWISKYFKMEESDYKSLDHPKEYILDKGGQILIALYKGVPVGTCAMIVVGNGKVELAKMAVSDSAKGKGVGLLLGKAIINLARQSGMSAVYLESNTILKPAINLYHKLGFKKIAGAPSPYERCNIQMELPL